jgi:antiviral helicase SKI2
MDDCHHNRIHRPRPGDEDQILQELGLDSLPSKETLQNTIEQQWLTPKEGLPDSWLGRYQV